MIAKRTLAGLAAGILLLVAGAAGAPAGAQDIPAKPEAGTFRMGIEPWLGYGPWQIAAKQGLFAKQGLGDVQIVNFTQDKDINAALASGQLDGSNIATHTALAMIQAGLKIKVVLLEDLSMAADAILAGKDINSVADLKGKQVAFEQGTTSDILLNYALRKNGLSIADVTPVPMPASDAGGALIAGRVPVAVTYEPYISVARGQNKDLKLLFTAGEDPGLISDVFVVREEVLKEKPGQVAALLRAWDEAVKSYRADTKGGQAIISESVGAKPEELETAFAGVRFYSLAENKEHLQGDFAQQTIKDVEQAAIKAGILTGPVETNGLIDPRFVDAAAK
jgi:NitT/TauT family transport system substrate-binding protein